jgi:hypothetical protein
MQEVACIASTPEINLALHKVLAIPWHDAACNAACARSYQGYRQPALGIIAALA